MCVGVPFYGLRSAGEKGCVGCLLSFGGFVIRFFSSSFGLLFILLRFPFGASRRVEGADGNGDGAMLCW